MLDVTARGTSGKFRHCFFDVPLFTPETVPYRDRRGDAFTGDGETRRQGWCHRGVGTSPRRVRDRSANPHAGNVGDDMGRRYDTISFLSDYGTADEFVGVVKSVIRELAPHAAVIDITHGITPFDVRAGSLALARSCSAFCSTLTSSAALASRLALALTLAAAMRAMAALTLPSDSFGSDASSLSGPNSLTACGWCT